MCSGVSLRPRAERCIVAAIAGKALGNTIIVTGLKANDVVTCSRGT